MNKPQNPFTISFGIAPGRSVERPEQINEIVDDFRNEKASNHIYMITGVRGVGKTVLLSMVSAALRTDDDWIVVDLNPNKDMLLSLAGKLYDLKETRRLFKDMDIDVSAFGVGISVKKNTHVPDAETVVGEMLRQLAKHKKRILITVDEAINNGHVKIFAGTFQSMLRDGLPVFLLMTGVYDNIHNLQNEKTLTFLYRAPKLMLGPLNLYAIKSIYQDTFHISEDMAVQMTKLTRGYPFAFQALGYLWWRAGGLEASDQEMMEQIIPQYDQYLEDYSYEKIWSETKETDQDFLICMAHQEEPTTMSIREELAISPQLFYKYHKRLVVKGLIRDGRNKALYFSLPRFGEFILRQEMFADI